MCAAAAAPALSCCCTTDELHASGQRLVLSYRSCPCCRPVLPIIAAEQQAPSNGAECVWWRCVTIASLPWDYSNQVLASHR